MEALLLIVVGIIIGVLFTLLLELDSDMVAQEQRSALIFG